MHYSISEKKNEPVVVEMVEIPEEEEVVVEMPRKIFKVKDIKSLPKDFERLSFFNFFYINGKKLFKPYLQMQCCFYRIASFVKSRSKGLLITKIGTSGSVQAVI